MKEYKKGDNVKVKVLDVDVEKERISLGIKQLGADPFAGSMGELKKGDVVTCTVASGARHTASRCRSRTARRRASSASPTWRATAPSSGPTASPSATGSMRASPTSTASDRKLTLSIKAHEVAEEKQAMQEYGSSDSGASLGDILGAAIRANREKAEQAEEQGRKTQGDGDDGEDGNG